MRATATEWRRRRGAILPVCGHTVLLSAPCQRPALRSTEDLATISAARQAQAAEPPHAQRAGRSASEASLRTDLELAKQDNRRLRAEVDRLKKALQERLGTQLEAKSAESLRRRIDDLTAANDRYRSDNSRLVAELDDARSRLHLAEDDLGAARTSLRRMIRDHSLVSEAVSRDG